MAQCQGEKRGISGALLMGTGSVVAVIGGLGSCHDRGLGSCHDRDLTNA